MTYNQVKTVMEKKIEALLSDGCIPTYGLLCISFKLDLHEQF